MARISLKEQYDNKDVITQIYALIDKEASNANGISYAQDTAETAIDTANKASKKVDDLVIATDAFDARITNAQSDATLALQQAEDAQTDADKGIITVDITTDAGNGTLYTKTNNNIEVRKNIPLASASQTGLMNAQTYQGLINLGNRVTALEAKKSTAFVVFTSNDPSQEEITEKFTAVVGRAPIGGDQVTDIAKALTYEYDGTIWIKTTAPVAAWTNEQAGIIKGTPTSGAAGTLFAEEDGTGSVNGWDELNTTIANNYTTLSKAFSGYSFTETATKIQVQFEAVDGATTVSEEIPAATEEKAGVLSAADWTRFGNKQNKVNTTTVTLTPGGWNDSVQTASVPGMTADAIVWVAPAADSFVAYTTSLMRATAQAAGSLTFTVDTVPEGNVVVNVGWSI